jgi:ribosomal protein S18 acetylase RimI-like enzyme
MSPILGNEIVLSMKTTLATRALTAADAGKFKAIRMLAAETSPAAIWPTYEEEARKPVEAVAARIAPTDTLTVYGAFDSGALVGIAGVRREPLAKIAHKATIWGVFVDPGYRRQGVAQDLLRATTEHAVREWHSAQLVLCVNAENTAAKALYVSLGFSTFGVEPRALFVDGRFYDEEHMYKALR